jgi:hypothetical protein
LRLCGCVAAHVACAAAGNASDRVSPQWIVVFVCTPRGPSTHKLQVLVGGYRCPVAFPLDRWAPTIPVISRAPRWNVAKFQAQFT